MWESRRPRWVPPDVRPGQAGGLRLERRLALPRRHLGAGAHCGGLSGRSHWEARLGKIWEQKWEKVGKIRVSCLKLRNWVRKLDPCYVEFNEIWSKMGIIGVKWDVIIVFDTKEVENGLVRNGTSLGIVLL